MGLKKIKLLINATSAKKGGGLYRVLEIINHLSKNEDFIIKIISSENLYNMLNKTITEQAIIMEITRLHIFKGNYFDDDFIPDLVFTPYGPSYLKFKEKHLVGFNNAWFYNKKLKDFFYIRDVSYSSVIDLLKLHIKSKSWKNSDWIWTETKISKMKIQEQYGFNEHRVFVIPNCTEDHLRTLPKKKNRKLHITYVSDFYTHKNHETIIRALVILKNRGIDCNLNTTISEAYEKDFFKLADKHNAKKLITNHQSIYGNELSSLYQKSDICVMPSLLETFSAAYAEAYTHKKPLICSNEDFAKDICGDYATYVSSKKPEEWAYAIEHIRAESKSCHGSSKTKDFNTKVSCKERMECFEDILKEIANNENVHS